MRVPLFSWRGWFTTDERSLALGRILLAFAVIQDLFSKLVYLSDFYTDDGVHPRESVPHFSGAWAWSLHLIFGSFYGQLVLFGLQFVASLFLLFGYHTTLATVVCWIFTVSAYHRNVLIHNFGDLALRCLLLWSSFLPIGRRFSADSIGALRSAAYPASHVDGFQLSSFALIWQAVLLYFVTALLKNGPEWHAFPDGPAAYFALSLDSYSRPFGRWVLLNASRLDLELLTSLVWLLEVMGVQIYILGNNGVRLVVSTCFIIMHIGFHMCLHLGIFSLVCIALWSMLLPPSLWDGLNQKLRRYRRRKGLKVFINARCSPQLERLVHGICMVTFLPMADTIQYEDLTMHPSHASSTSPESGAEKVVVQPRNTTNTAKEGAVLRVTDDSGETWYQEAALLRLAAAVPLCETLMSICFSRCRSAAIRMFFPTSPRPLLRPPRRLPRVCSLFRTMALCVLLISVTLSALYVIDSATSENASLSPLYPITQLLAIDQHWAMFSPAPPKDDGWFVFHGHTLNGTALDPFRGGMPVMTKKPADVHASYGSFRWVSYFSYAWYLHTAADDHDVASLRHVLYTDLGNRLCRAYFSQHLHQILSTYVANETLLRHDFDSFADAAIAANLAGPKRDAQAGANADENFAKLSSIWTTHVPSHTLSEFEKLVWAIDIRFIEETTPRYGERPQLTKWYLWTHNCVSLNGSELPVT